MAVFAVIKYAGRCGSHWLRSCLNSHPDVFVLRNEQFDIDTDIWKCKEKWPRLIENVFDTFGSTGSHGCLVKANYVGNPLWYPLREEIARVPGIHIIQNSRHDYLAQYVSMITASATGQFSSYLDPVQVDPLVVDTGKMLRAFANWDKKFKAHKKIYAGLPFYQLYYEDMENDLLGVMKQIYQFIGVDASHCPVFSTKKQRSRALRDAIDNYDVVVGAIQDSRWVDRLSDL